MHTFLDDDYWIELAKKYKVRLPQRGTALTTGGVERWLKKLNITNTQFRMCTGGMTKKKFVEANLPLGWTLRAFVGLILESVEDDTFAGCTELEPTLVA